MRIGGGPWVVLATGGGCAGCCPSTALEAAIADTPSVATAIASNPQFPRPLMCPPRGVASRLPGARSRRVRFAEPVPAVRHDERAVRLRGDFDPVGGRVWRQRGPSPARRRHRRAPPPGAPPPRRRAG